MKIIVIIQARLSSKRLPEKILKKIYKNYNSLEIIFKRLSKLKSCSRIIFAIPKNENKLSKYLNKKKLPFYSGSPTNVLDRYYKCALKERADIIVRITADCPLIDPKIVDDAISLFIKKKDIDLLSNYSPPTFPDGQDVAVFSFSALKYAWSNAISKFDKEHVVNYLIQSKKINRFNFENKIDLSNMRITLDEKEDLKVIKNIFNLPIFLIVL